MTELDTENSHCADCGNSIRYSGREEGAKSGQCGVWAMSIKNVA
jgi:hypothetical protein